MKIAWIWTLVGLAFAAPVQAFSPQECAENYVADGLPADARAEAVLEYFVEPGQLGGELTCTLIATEAFGRIIQVSEPMPDSPHGAFVQYFPDRLQIQRAEGGGAGLSLTQCGPIPDDLPPERLPGGFWCRIDMAQGRGVRFVLEYDTDGGLAWLNFEVASGAGSIVDGSTLAPVLPETSADDLRAAVFLSAPETTHLLRFVRGAEVFRMAEPADIITLYRTLRDTPQATTVVIETGPPGTGPFAQAELTQSMLEAILAELALAEQLIRTDRGL